MDELGRRRFLAALGAAALARPLVCGAQGTAKVPQIGILMLELTDANWVRTKRRWLVEHLGSAGYEVGKNIFVEWRFAEGRKERLPQLAADLVRLKVDVIVAFAPLAVHAASQATRSIPIVMDSYFEDPIKKGLAESIGRPGGNVTGTLWAVNVTDIVLKQYELLRIALPSARRVASLWWAPDPTWLEWGAKLNVRIEKEFGLVVSDFIVQGENEIPSALARIADFKPDAFYVSMGAEIRGRVKEIVAFAKQHKLVSMASSGPWPQEGGLMTYALDGNHMLGRTMSFVVRILHGAKPGNLAIEQPSRFALVFNMRTAREIGYEPSSEFLLRVDQLIE